MLSGATGRVIPGANIYLSGAVPTGTLVSAHGAHLRKQATEDSDVPSAHMVAPPTFLSPIFLSAVS